MGDYQVSTTNVEIELGSPTLVNLTKFAMDGKLLWESCQDHVGMVSPCIFVVVCVLTVLLSVPWVIQAWHPAIRHSEVWDIPNF